ncbi:DNA cytosine methyltransferase [Kingella kingae]|uniref:DNA cytosine methyltransferase n=1 Tax=Kingella kingae TaxID=504 RepID=UPI000258692F|nr:DNA cytosine methyltransferase [Kingella kingae]EIC12776.1 site-specific DNA-methyltransferase [Kingella kingae PYKK081]MBD3614513.1 DNA cytosine methyltransferase [Kingella kingae]MBD3632750.1 DNA cytosine methyltransferase [Kingella kingae]MBD3660107.1 DNA cytosine methyltransferase [Kingella kingae]MDK4544428.1 DNA cytosine methyltransferase [Kingella kingae]
MNRIIDLFAGCGGMSLGFEMAGFQSVLAVEKDAWAAETYQFNHQDTFVHVGDITEIANPKQIFDYENISGIIGGPPCQGFSLSGSRDPKDPRNSLFMDYMRFVGDFNPSFFVMENVPGILSAKTKNGQLVKEVISSVALSHGYNVHILHLNAANYGVPQARNRIFFIGIRQDYSFIMRYLQPEKITTDKPITLWDAISDLPQIEAGQGVEVVDYADLPKNTYQAWCREHSNAIHNHISMKHTQRLIERFKCIEWGQSVADVPEEHKQRKRGDATEISGKTYSQNNMRPRPDKPAPTLPASFQSNFIHPYLHRNFTAREGARLQSFPDNYIFKGKRTTMSWEKNLSQFQQIGNAVPPLLAKALGLMIKRYFRIIQEQPNLTNDVVANDELQLDLFG